MAPLNHPSSLATIRSPNQPTPSPPPSSTFSAISNTTPHTPNTPTAPFHRLALDLDLPETNCALQSALRRHPLSPPLSPNTHIHIRKCPSAASRRTTATTKLNSASFDSIPLILPKFSRPSELNLPSPTQPDTLASIYMVCGLPKNPQCWTLAQPDYPPTHLQGALPRFWRPEVLGTTVSGQETPDPARESNSPPDIGAGPEPISKDELSKIQGKAIKLAFARELEVIASPVQPPSTTHCFSFTVPAQPGDDLSGSLGHQWDPSLTSSSTDSATRQPPEKTYYAACLQVWSHSDRRRADAICKTLQEGSKAVNSPMGLLPSSADLSSNAAVYHSQLNGLSTAAAPSAAGESTDTDDPEGFFSDSEWETGTELLSDHIASRLTNNTSTQTAPNAPLWLPFCLVLISKFPLYDLLVDHLKISWARYHNSIYKHSQEMLKMLNFTLPKSSSVIKLPVGSSKESNTKFIVKLPGKNDLSNEGLEEVNFTMWPLFKCLSIQHIVSIYEIGLSPMGRIVFFSSHPAILNIAVESFKLLLELRGWVGLSQSIIHSRDFKIYLEDPGPFILGANSQLRHIAADVSPEIMIVDLDTDTIRCPKPHPDALSKGQDRMKIERKLYNLLGNFTGPKAVPAELQEAFPGGRFRPFSAVEIKDQPSEAERLLPPPEWNWSQTRTVILFDDVMSKMPRKGFGKILKRTTNRQAAVLDSSALHVQEIIRKHTIRFVDRRDMLETKIWKLNRRLAFLMSESMEWKQHFDNFQKFTDMLSTESQDLKTRLETERREHRTLTGVVAEQKSRQVELEGRLLETEKAWMAAQVELAKAQEIREELQRQKEIMVSEMKSIALGGEDENMLGQIVPRIGSYPMRRASVSHNRQISLTTKNLRRLSAQDRLASASPCSNSRLEPHEESEFETEYSLGRLGSAGGYGNFLGAESEVETISDDASALSEIPDDDQRALLSRSAVVETMKSIQCRLEAALRTAGQLDEEELKGYEVNSPFPKSALSRMSTDSQGSKVIPLQRGRRKPNSSVNFESDNTTSFSISSSPAPNTESILADSPTDDPPIPSNRQPKRATGSAVVSLLLPGSSIFRGKMNNGLGDSQTSYTSAFNSEEVLGTGESGDDDDDDDNDDDSNDRRSEVDDGNSFDDDGESFVSANDQSDNADRRRISSDSCYFHSLNPDLSSPNATSRVSILCASPSRPTCRPPPLPSHTTSKLAGRKSLKKASSGMIAFPTSPSELDEEEDSGELRVQKYLDDRRDYRCVELAGNPDLTANSGSDKDWTLMGLRGAYEQPGSPTATLDGTKPMATDGLMSPIHHRGSFVSNCSSTTVRHASGQPALPHSPLVPIRTLHRQSRASHTTIKLSSTSPRHTLSPPPTPHTHPNETGYPARTDLVDFPLDNLRLNLGSIQSSRRLRSSPSPTTPLYPAPHRPPHDCSPK
ncbi:hypothetical protein PtA15_3A68 [Puccinia triticina]|uniref:cDENN domain-containing protein n=1 Tax=Puccinia triticina TaxID=208348 RepID=A0ABY7CDD8_9BASI|nr:uncharacterized protein PtA15_3A68 [Puccinia triticina]WAQ82704.1 hypothetical protein PtA15_3A68 [Puccinia triticina]